ncbi:MAG: outer membrane protein assembly factor BamC [Methylococcaceae bacterium]|jgi:uncharacterized lipoprotein
MFFKFIRLLIILPVLAICACSTDTRYRDNSALEKPPALPRVSSTANLTELEEQVKSTEPASTSVPRQREEHEGLLYLSDTKPIQLTISQSQDIVWDIIALALKKARIEITDQNRDEGLFYVTFDPDDFASEDKSLFDALTFSLLKNEYPVANYVLKLNSADNETLITAEQVIKSSQRDPANQEDGQSHPKSDGDEKLLKTLYQTIQEGLKDKKSPAKPTEQPAQWNP